MEKIEKFRKNCRIVQYAGMGVIILVGIFLVYWFGFRGSSDTQTSSMNTLTYAMGTILVLFAYMVLVITPMSNTLLKKIIAESLNGVVTELTFSRKKGFTKENFEKFGVSNGVGDTYACTDYYSFNYKGQFIESATIDSSTTQKVKQNKKTKKINVKYFLGRVYVLPFKNESQVKFRVLGKVNPGVSKIKQMEEKGFSNIPLKFKKHFDNFEVFYATEKPVINVQEFVDKLNNLRMSCKGEVSAIVRKESIVLCINNGKYYEEVDLKNPIDINLVRGYKKDVMAVLNFLDVLNKE